MPLFDEVKRLSTSQTIVEQVKQLILRGDLRPGQKLPTERELATELGVGRSSVREATSALLALGIVEVHPGEGVFIRSDFPRSTLESVSWSSLMLNGHSNDLSEARLAIEVAIAEMAALRATPQQRETLRRLANAMAVAQDAEIAIDLDIQFHLALAEASQNIVLREIVAGIQHLMRSSMVQVIRSEAMKALSTEQHRHLCEAIDRRSSREAADIMRSHLLKDPHISDADLHSP